jgi:hypothetical protein
MVRSISVFFAVLVLPPTWALADSPEEFLTNIVQSDFQGDPAPRANRVTFSDKSAQAAYQKARSRADQIPEIYSLDMDPIMVVSDWKSIIPYNYGTTQSCVDVQFTLLARSQGKNLPSWISNRARKFVALRSPTLETVRYCAVAINGQWMLVDPPLPRVEKAVVIRVLKEELQSAENRITDGATYDPRAIKNMTVIRDSLASQLAALESLSN